MGGKAEIGNPAIAIFVAETSRRLPAVLALASCEQVNPVLIEPQEVLLVLDLIVGNALRNRVVRVLYMDVEPLEWRVELEVATDGAPVSALPGIVPRRVVQHQERAAFLHEHLYRRLLVRLHPPLGLRVMAVRPLHAVSMKDQQLFARQLFGVDSSEFFCKFGVQTGGLKYGTDPGKSLFGPVIPVTGQHYSIGHIGCLRGKNCSTEPALAECNTSLLNGR